MSDGGDFDGGSYDIDIGTSDYGNIETNGTNTNDCLSKPSHLQFFVSCILMIFFFAIDAMANVIFFSNDAEKTIIIIIVFEFTGASLLYALPSVIISCLPKGKPRYIYAIICAVINLGGLLMVIIAVICCFVLLEETGDAIPVCMLSIFNSIILLIRFGFTFFCFIKTKGYNSDEIDSNETYQNNVNEEGEVDMREVQNEQNENNN